MNRLRAHWRLLAGCLALLASLPGGAQTTITGTDVPLPPPRKAPTEIFRELLAAAPGERERQLSQRSAAARALIEAKLREFESLPPDQRELRLRVAELQFFLSPLLKAPASDRKPLLDLVPEELRPLLVERLRAWDALSAAQQRDLVESERSFSWFVRLQATDLRSVTNALAQLPSAQRTEVETQWARWQALSAGERARRTAEFRQFFDLSDRERSKVLSAISPTERRQMEASLDRLAELPPDQRDRALSGFRRFLALTAPDRAQFLQNVAQWQAMTPAERAAWRQIVTLVTTPTPTPESRQNRPQLLATNSVAR